MPNLRNGPNFTGENKMAKKPASLAQNAPADAGKHAAAKKDKVQQQKKTKKTSK